MESGAPFRGTDVPQGPPPSYNPLQPVSAGPTDIPNPDRNTTQKPPSSASSLSDSDHEDVGPARTAGSVRRSKSRGHVDQDHSESSSDDTHRTDRLQESTVQQVSTYSGPAGFSTHRASTSLLQMVPYRHNAAYARQGTLFISAGPDGSTRPATVTGSAMEEATRSVRLLLDKWTTSGSAPVSEILAETENTKSQAQ